MRHRSIAAVAFMALMFFGSTRQADAQVVLQIGSGSPYTYASYYPGSVVYPAGGFVHPGSYIYPATGFAYPYPTYSYSWGWNAWSPYRYGNPWVGNTWGGNYNYRYNYGWNTGWRGGRW